MFVLLSMNIRSFREHGLEAPDICTRITGDPPHVFALANACFGIADDVAEGGMPLLCVRFECCTCCFEGFCALLDERGEIMIPFRKDVKCGLLRMSYCMSVDRMAWTRTASPQRCSRTQVQQEAPYNQCSRIGSSLRLRACFACHCSVSHWMDILIFDGQQLSSVLHEGVCFEASLLCDPISLLGRCH